jgi:hypothetical protein
LQYIFAFKELRKMVKHTLSKSTFMYGCQCPKRLFLHKFKPELANPVEEAQEAIFQSGTDVGVLARDLFPGGKDASPSDTFSYQKSVQLTKELIDAGANVIYEACFQFDGVLCALDILVKKRGKWYAYEVKGSTSVKEQYLQDAALQYYVITQSGLPLQDFSIVHLNNEYIRQGDLNIQQLFTIESVNNEVTELQDFVKEKIAELKSLLTKKKEPVMDIGPHCSDPYGCNFTNHCWKDFPKVDNIFSLLYGPGWLLYNDGYKHLDEIPEDYPLQKRPAFQLKHYRSGETHIDAEAIGEFLQTIEYPLYFFDFETYMPAVPEFDYSRPYQQVPFQYSLHVLKSPNSKLEHYSFLGDGVNDPREKLIQGMLNLLGTKGSIIGWNVSFEKTRIKELAENFPKYGRRLLALNERMVDLMMPFKSRWYYHPEFQGSASIKNILPVLVSELSYEKLSIQEGGTASLVYTQLKNMDKQTAAGNMNDLLEYCHLDTLAMIKIWEKLQDV